MCHRAPRKMLEKVRGSTQAQHYPSRSRSLEPLDLQWYIIFHPISQIKATSSPEWLYENQSASIRMQENEVCGEGEGHYGSGALGGPTLLMPSENSRKQGREGSVRRRKAGGDKNCFLNSSARLFFDPSLFPSENIFSWEPVLELCPCTFSCLMQTYLSHPRQHLCYV